MNNLARVVLALLAPFAGNVAADLVDVPDLHYEVVGRRPSDRSLFTQGLLIHDGWLYQSGGQYRASRLVSRPLDDRPGGVSRPLPPAWWAEGIAVIGDELVLLTWREGTGARYALPTLEERGRFHYSGPGWGLTSDGRQLVMSDGSDTLYWRRAEDFVVTRELPVRAGADSVENLNELEWIEGRVFANVWLTDWVVSIDPHSGSITGKLDLSGLLTPRERRRADVLNGIAWDAASRRLFVTGKYWPWLFELRVQELSEPPTARNGIESPPSE